MNKRNKALVLASCSSLALGLASSAYAGDGGNPFIKVGAETGMKEISVLEGKCGGGKCGSSRVRRMMDSDGNGTISRSEYTGWAARMASDEFDAISKTGGEAPAKDVFDFFGGVEHLGA